MHFNCRIEAYDTVCKTMICGMKILKRFLKKLAVEM